MNLTVQYKHKLHPWFVSPGNYAYTLCEVTVPATEIAQTPSALDCPKCLDLQHRFERVKLYRERLNK